MNLPIWLNKRIISFRPIMQTPFWWWYRLMCHEGFRFDDYYMWKSFWYSLNGGWEDMNYRWAFEEYWGKGSYPPERIVLPQKDFDALVERLDSPPDPEAVESIRKILNRKAPWDDDYGN